MSIKQQKHETDGIYFITVTCYNWLPLFQITNTYDAVFKWSNYLKQKGHYITGYVIMPNHLHAFVSQPSLPTGTRRKNTLKIIVLSSDVR